MSIQLLKGCFDRGQDNRYCNPQNTDQEKVNKSMKTSPVRRHRLVKALGISVTLSLFAVVSGCATTPAAEPEGGGEITVQGAFSGAEADGLAAAVEAFNALGEGTVEIDSISAQQQREQIATSLSAPNPPDVLTWFAGKATRDFADEGLLLDLSDVWTESLSDFSPALRDLSTNSEGQQVFVPTQNYWWGIYYKKSEFEANGWEIPADWDSFLALLQEVKDSGQIPLGIPLGDSPWTASAWFDYLNSRINGGPSHLGLLAGDTSFDSPAVSDVMDAYADVLPYFDPDAAGVTFPQFTSDFAEGKTAMALMGAFWQAGLPEDTQSDLAFFQFPTIDPSIPVVEEAPTNGLLVSVNSDNPTLAKKFVAFVASPEGQALLLSSSTGALGTNPTTTRELSDLETQGLDMLQSAAQLTQFFNRDGGEALQPTADSALVRFFFAPGEVDQILVDWQAAAERARAL